MRWTLTWSVSSENGRAHSAGTLYRCNIVRGAMYRSLAPILEECNVLVCPSLAVPTVAAEHDCGAEDFRVNGKPVHAYLGWNLCYPFNMVSQCPVIAVPSGLSTAGLPTGIQIVGRTYGRSERLPGRGGLRGRQSPGGTCSRRSDPPHALSPRLSNPEPHHDR